MPEQGLHSRAVVLRPKNMKLSELEKNLREAPVPIIGRVEHERMLFDMRTVADDEVVVLAQTLCSVFGVE